jgi:hypothetical protein
MVSIAKRKFYQVLAQRAYYLNVVVGFFVARDEQCDNVD